VAAPSPEELRREFLLDPEVAFLNHGSFGACPRLVFERYQAWQDLLRLSVAGYTSRDEIDRLLAALARELDAEHGQRDE
jgi:isopenicillin-N epimerase